MNTITPQLPASAVLAARHLHHSHALATAHAAPQLVSPQVAVVMVVLLVLVITAARVARSVADKMMNTVTSLVRVASRMATAAALSGVAIALVLIVALMGRH